MVRLNDSPNMTTAVYCGRKTTTKTYLTRGTVNPYHSGPGCSKLTMSLVNVPLNFQELISQICQYFLLKKCENSHFFNKKFQCIWL